MAAACLITVAQYTGRRRWRAATWTASDNGAVIALLAVTGLTHRDSYRYIFAVTIIKTASVFVAIAFFYLTGIY